MLKRRLITGVLTIATLLVPVLSMSQPTFATELNSFEESKYESRVSSDLYETEKYLDSLSVEELNQYIDYIANSEDKRYEMSPGSSLNIIRNAWLAAAKIAEKKGYTVSAKLVKCSVYGRDYTENNGLIAGKVKKSSEFKEWTRTHKDDSFNFETGDLFYALHSVDMFVISMSSQGSKFHMHDEFDFKIENYEKLFAHTVNNWAWLCQTAHILEEIDVDVYFSN